MAKRPAARPVPEVTPAPASKSARRERVYRAYLSSTLNDLRAERQVVKDELGDEVLITESYRASEQELVESCLEDVARCDLYIGIVGLRYGFVPSGKENPRKLSITQLEYQKARDLKIPCLVFLKHEDDIPFGLTDAKSNEHPMDSVRQLRARMSGDQRPALFSDVDGLGRAVRKAFSEFKRTRQAEKRQSRTAISKPSAPSAARIRADYVEYLRAECEKVVLFGLDLRDRQQNVRLGQVYVPAITTHTQEEQVAKAGTKRKKPQSDDSERFELLLRRLGRKSLYVPGAPGAGKSTFCRWAALSVASGRTLAEADDIPDEFREKLPNELRARFPLLCELRRWGNEDRPWLAGSGAWTRKQFENAVAAWIDATQPGGLTSAAFGEVVTKGQALVILDGVDELPEQVGRHYPRKSFLSGLAEALPRWMRVGNRILLTSRPYGVRDAERRSLGLEQAELLPMPRQLQTAFAKRWFVAGDVACGADTARGLMAHLDSRPELNDLRQNPMLLTALCVKYDQDVRLPRDLFKLYEAVTNQVLYKRYDTEVERGLARLRLSAVALAMHEGPPRAPRETPAPHVPFEEVDSALSKLGQTDTATEQGSLDAAERRENLLSNSGLLLTRGERVAGFYHFSFQEFYAAVRLRMLEADARVVLDQRAVTPSWRLTLRFLFCAIADQRPELALRAFESVLTRVERNELAESYVPALVLADCLEVARARDWSAPSFAAAFRKACDAALEVLEPPARAELWTALGDLGLDDRRGVGLEGGVPDIDWISIPAGPFLFGFPYERATVDAFRVSRYLVTNVQFNAFIDDGGFKRDEWWDGRLLPAGPGDSAWGHANHPRAHVSWFDARAFCRWLTGQLRASAAIARDEVVRLPTEVEWERVARGTDNRWYPWGNFFESGCANVNETHEHKGKFFLRNTSTVGIYPTGASPDGALDMSGNVWEWCDGPGHPKRGFANANRVLRGGAWLYGPFDASASSSSYFRPEDRYPYIGFRVVVSPIQ